LETEPSHEPRPDLLWPDPPAELTLQPAEVHVFAAWLDDNPALERMRPLLSRDEKARSNRFKFERDRKRFMAGRGWLRTILAHYLETNPAKIHFRYDSSGKPALAERFASSEVRFNLAHSEALALLAVTT